MHPTCDKFGIVGDTSELLWLTPVRTCSVSMIHSWQALTKAHAFADGVLVPAQL